jgi:ATP-dependent helicase/nuclease subunit B
VPSRWLLRLEALTSGPLAAAVAARGARWLRWQEALDRPAFETRQPRPAPCPPLHVRPRELSVTEIETWVRDPYALFARKILGLKALAPIDPDPDAADFGRFVHQALDDFIGETPGDLADDALAHLLACGERHFGNMPREAAVRAFWWPRFQQIARWFVAAERQRRGNLERSATEVKGLLVLETVSPPFTVRARADRIDQLKDGSLVTIDYKTGAPPTRREVGAGFAPQLPLEALIAMHGGFEGIPAGNVAALEYWRLKATGGEIQGLEGGRARLPPAPELAARARAQLEALIARFDDPSTPYLPRPRPRYAPAHSDYEHLARIKEWSVTGAEDGGEDGGGDGA